MLLSGAGTSFIVLAAVLLAVDCSHYRGSTISWKYLGGGKVRIEFELVWNRNTADGKTTDTLEKCDATIIKDRTLSGQAVQWACLNKNCGPGKDKIDTMQYECTAFSEEEKFSLGGRSIDVDLPLNTVVHFGNDPEGAHKCCWITPLVNNAQQNSPVIRFYTEINLNPRPDNGLINNSPKTGTFPVVRARTGCAFHYVIHFSDPDHDRVRCRWALDKTDDDDGLDECGSLCRETGTFGATLNEATCEIDWIAAGVGRYGVAVVLEDYAPSHPNQLLSEVPLQFVVDVAAATVSCDEQPFFCCDTPDDSECFAISMNSMFNFTVSANHTSRDHSVSRVDLSGPWGMTKSPLMDVAGLPGVKQTVISWTPVGDQYDNVFFVCFVAVDNVGGGTEERCLTLIPGMDPPRVRLDTRYPRNGDDFTPGLNSSQISFNTKIRRPTVHRYIKVFEFDTDNLIEMIDTSTSLHVRISPDSLTASFQLQNSYRGGTRYYILMDRGAFVGADVSCSGGGPVTDGVLTKDAWSFTTSISCASDDDCHDHGNCMSSTCICDIGFSGDGIRFCDDIDECTDGTANCDLNAICTNTVPLFTCTCLSGYEGDGINCDDINECTRGTHDCSASEICVNLMGSFRCNCISGHERINGMCVDIDECIRGTANCQANEHCVNTVGSFNCICNGGYERIGASCVDIDECTRGSPCGSNADCRNTAGSFTCNCHTGYELIGMTCVNVNECVRNDPCHPQALCIDTPGSFTCQCITGYTGDGVTLCVRCFVDSDCHPDGQCVSVSGSRACVCKPGFTGDGKTDCHAIDPCSDGTSNCHRDADCVNMRGSFECICKTGFSGDGVTSCIDVTNCTRDWPTQRNNWINLNKEWMNTTRNCADLGDALPKVSYDSDDPPIQQWRNVSQSYLKELNAWLKSASSLNVPGIPSSVSFNETDPEKLWNQMKDFMNNVMDVWYEHIGKPNGMEKREPSGQCDDKQVEQWVQADAASEKSQSDFEGTFHGRCDAR